MHTKIRMMIALALLSVYAVAVVIFKIIQFHKANVFDRFIALSDLHQKCLLEVGVDRDSVSIIRNAAEARKSKAHSKTAS